MTPRRDYLTCLSAYYARRFPLRPPKVAFSDELLAFADMLMAQLDRDGVRPLVCPPMPAHEGYEQQKSARPTGKRGVSRGD